MRMRAHVQTRRNANTHRQSKWAQAQMTHARTPTRTDKRAHTHTHTHTGTERSEPPTGVFAKPKRHTLQSCKAAALLTEASGDDFCRGEEAAADSRVLRPAQRRT
eukprot:GHVU01024428.1.p3 GENE.GHVU01024428.1~~GHVU01024428.1.p3  ORF type:complete len:105 (+),score=11.27 GHVU01024428.1:244-558(+)